jgi:predicted transcriptional regulator
MSGKNLSFVEVYRTQNFETGEVVEDVITQQFKSEAEPPYIKMYIENLCAINGVTDADQALLRHLLAKLDYSGYVTLSPRSKEVIAKDLRISKKTVRNRLTRLTKSGLIKLTSMNEYMVNPDYFARGKWKDVCDQRREFSLLLTYSESKGREVSFTTKDSYN